MDPRGCLLFIIFGIFTPFIPGIIGCFCLGGWLLGLGAILYTILVFFICSLFDDDRKSRVYFFLMIPFYIFNICAFFHGVREGNI